MSLQEHLRQLSPGHKRQLLARLLQSHSAARDGLPYSYDQEQAWSLHRSAPDSSRANLGAAIYLPGAAVSGLHSALADVIAAHESLRLAFRNDSLRIRPFLADECRLHPASFDLRPLAEARRAEAIHRITREQLLAPFDLNEAPLFRLTLLQLEPAQYLLFLTAHEIVSDAWSLLILLQEISDRAHAYGGGFPANDRPAAPAFSRVAAEMRSRPDDDGRFQYWLERLRDAPEPARLPGTNGLADKRSILGRVHSIEVPATTYAGLRSLSSETGDSLVPVLFAAYAVWLHLRTGAEDLVVGVPAPNREQPERLGLVGPIGGYLPIRLNLSGDPTFAELQGAAFPLLSEALGGAAPSVAELARSLAPERLVDRHPLFRHTFFLQDFSQNGTARRDLKAMASWQPVALAAQHDLSLTFLAGPNQLVVRAEYAADLFDAKTVRDWFEQFLVLLAQLAAAPERPISTLRTAEDATPRRDGAGVTQSQPHPVPAAASVSVSRQADVSAPLPPPRKAPLESPRPTSESSAGQGEDPIFEVLHAAWREFLPVDVVGIDQNFFELGGHSLLAMQVHSLLIEALGVEAPLRLQFEAADLGDLAQRVREEIPNVAAAVESARAWLRKRGANGAARTTAAARATAPTREPAAAPSPAESRDAFGHARSDGANGALPSVPAPREPAAATGAKSPSPGVPLGREVGRAPASFAQQRLWFLDQLDPGSSFYNLHFAMKFAGPLDRAALRGALNEIVSRHEPLRTTFAADDSGTPVQVIREPFEVTLPREDLRLLNASDRSDAIRKRLMEEVNQPFNLATGPLIRARLLRTAPQEHLLALSLHHIVVDVWSIRVLVDELQKLYQNFGAGRPSPLPPLKTRYRDFAEWQHEMLRGDQLEELVGYWRKQLDGAPAVLELPADRPRPPFQSFSGAMLSFEIDPQTVHGISELARQERATPFMVLLAGFAVVLSRHAHRYDLVIGAPIITRGRTDLEHLIGLFSNTLVLRLNLSGEPSFRELVQRARSVTVDAYAHQDLPFEKLVDELQPERNLGHNPLFQVMFSYDVDNERDLQAPDDTLPAIHSGTSKFDFGLYCTQTRQGLVCAF
ncbi:MAG: hypothetical protein LAQ69_16575, partial [Acidobacteriia bacterium]|nr:hypothetical protein [Terriglobia bacterium]